MIDWNDPAARLAHIERVGPAAYNADLAAHRDESTVATINGHAIRPMASQFGRLFVLGDTRQAFRSIGKAAAVAAGDAFDKAAGCDDLDEACAILQRACGIESDAGTGVYFSGFDAYDWRRRTDARRAEILIDWLATEFRAES